MRSDWSALGIAVGHATDAPGGTGLTVIRGVDAPLRAAVAVLGRATGTREIGALAPDHVAARTDAILLTGGSAYGLDAASGIMRWMEERGRGYGVPGGVVPIVPAAVIFDLSPCGSFTARPNAEMAYDACDRALPNFVEEGSVGAGTGATVGKGLGIEYAMKGGVGCWTEQVGALEIGALAVVNALGDVRDECGRIVAGARKMDGTYLDVAATLRGIPAGGPAHLTTPNTTLAVVAMNATFSRTELAQVAKAAGAALARRITPASTSHDGDIVFAICPLNSAPSPSLLHVEVLAEHVLGVAIERSVRMSRTLGGIPGLGGEVLS
ncbi:MAG: P1 family peptidase [Anaerolineae bacterium]|nr:P1 family peptidase [Gemmatimonadaceae bacterium]